MNAKVKTIGLALLFGVIIWVLDAILDFYIFYEGTFWNLLLFDIPQHELYIRTLILFCFFIFGIINWRNLSKLKTSNNELHVVNQQLLASEQQLMAANQQLDASNQQLLASEQQLRLMNTNLKKAKEQAEEGARLKTAFLANMSHEIRTPMNGIIGFTELLANPDFDNDKHQYYISVIRKSGERLLGTVNDIVEISKIETGQVGVSLTEVNLYTEVAELCSFYKQEAALKGVEVVFLNKPTQDIIKTDIVKLTSILNNLIKNAIKYTVKGRVFVNYVIEEEVIQFSVEDTGIGIPDNCIDVIFNRFERVDVSNTKIFEGAGLGLAIVKSYVEMLGGQIDVNSEVGKGSKFVFEILAN